MRHNHRLTVRASVLTGFAAVCARHRVDPRPLLRQAGLPRDAEADPERRFAATQVAAVLEAGAAACDCADFGLQMTQQRGLSILGPVGLLARDAPTIGAAMATIAEYMPIHNDALVVTMEDHGASITIGVAILCTPPHAQAHDIAVAMSYRIVRELAGPDWHPEQVSLSRARPADPRSFGAFFGQRPVFAAGYDGITLARAVFDLPNRFADATFHQLTQRQLPAGDRHAQDGIVARVRRILPILIANQHCTAEHVAGRLGMSRRTLTRQLADADLTFLALLDTVRDEIAQQQFALPGRKLADIADTLGFSSPAAFSGWFRRRHNAAPRDWRRRHAGG